MKIIIKVSVACFMLYMIAYSNNIQQLQALIDEIIRNDPRNEGIKVSVYFGDKPSILIYDLKTISGNHSMMDVLRVLFQFSEKVKDDKYSEVKLAFRKKTKFIINGDYFQKLGQEYSFQNPVYTTRTLPENLFNPDGTKAFNSWTGGLMGVINRQMEDLKDFSTKWYLAELSQEIINAETLNNTDTEIATKKENSKELIPEDEGSSKKNFRMTHWGMSKEQVKKVESSEFIKEQKGLRVVKGLILLIYKDNIAGLDCFIAYYFAENKLTRGRYLFKKKHSNKNLYISDFNNVKKQLTNKYGKPKYDNLIWINDLYKDDPSRYGMAVSKGDLKYVAKWDLQETEIISSLSGDNYKITFQTEYLGKALKEFEKKVLEKAKKDIW